MPVFFLLRFLHGAGGRPVLTLLFLASLAEDFPLFDSEVGSPGWADSGSCPPLRLALFSGQPRFGYGKNLI